MQKLLTFFQQKNSRILYIESAKTVNKMTLNELVNDALNNWAQNNKTLMYLVDQTCVNLK